MFRKLFTIVLGLMLLGGFAVAEAHEEVNLELRVKIDGSTFDVALVDIVGIGGAFYVTGDICQELGPVGTCVSIGTFHCWGWLFNASDPASSAVVSQEYNLDGRGKIQVQGVEDGGPRAVTGGTGDFRNVRGEATEFDFSNFLSDGEFTGTFKLELDDDDDDSDSDSDSVANANPANNSSSGTVTAKSDIGANATAAGAISLPFLLLLSLAAFLARRRATAMTTDS